MADNFSISSDGNLDDKNFICGVVEGFYGRPWTTEQRKDLFQKLKKWGMDSYVYAPKDDYKHRAYWRELYTVEEAEHLTGLISAAKAQGIVFYYALSPGLDISYSSQKEIATLKRKLEQVSQFGCTAFALLFDDIEPEMSEADKEIFQSFAHAQVSVTNDVWRHLSGPRFLLCPTQYCGSRANPNISTSDYLNTLGSKLDPHINIMWTGQKVISKNITANCIEEIARVLRRPPVIWDNLHANDYDQKRVFLGPYCGRSPALIPLLRGVLTNPNCEYNANCVPIHTLAQWAKCTMLSEDIDAAVGADGKLERERDAKQVGDKMEGDAAEDHDAEEEENGEEDILTGAGNAQVYNHQQALRNAVKEWLPEFFIPKTSYGPITKPQPVINVPPAPIIPILPSINTCMSLTSNTSTVTTPSVQSSPSVSTTTMTSSIPTIPTLNTSQLHALADVCSQVAGAEKTLCISSNTIVTGTFTPVMNSLVSETQVIMDEAIPNPIVPLISSNAALRLPPVMPVSTILGPVAASAVLSPMCGANLQDAKTDISDPTCPTSNGLMFLEDHEDVDIRVDGDSDKETDSAKNGIINVTDLDKESESASISVHINENTQDSDVTMSDGIGDASTMQVEASGSPDNQDMMVESPINNESVDGDSEGRLDLSEDDLMLLCELFYLPFAHGKRGLKLLNSFHWLHTRATLLLPPTRELNNQEFLSRWRRRCSLFLAQCASVTRLARRLSLAPNREITSDLISYVVELRAVTTLLATHIRWLGLGKFPHNISTYTQCNYTWFSAGWRAAFESGIQEPWVFRGGLEADLRRLLPPAASPLPSAPLPATPLPADTRFYTVRPYNCTDHDHVCDICHRTCRDGGDCAFLFPEHLRSLPSDRLVSPFLNLNPEYCMVVEDETECSYPEGSWPRSHSKEFLDGPSNVEIVGYACGAMDSRQFYKKQEVAWVPEMARKYPLSLLDTGEDLSTAAKESIQNFHNFEYSLPDSIHSQYPSIVVCSVLPDCQDANVPRRLMTCLMAALRANGSHGVHVCINPTDQYMRALYQRIGFVELQPASETATRLYLGRTF